MDDGQLKSLGVWEIRKRGCRIVRKGSEAAGNQCEQSSEEAWKIKENPYTKGRKDKTKIKKVEEN